MEPSPIASFQSVWWWEAASPRGPALLIQASLLPSSTVPTQRKLHPQCFTFNMSLLSVRKHLPRGVLSDPAVDLRPTCPAYLTYTVHTINSPSSITLLPPRSRRPTSAP
ncbi:hypothetical protein K456DRAFT_53894 [Colletotrichum gloeosporioides 23]|nr:hypothetical protein K456DRAFT_53894 [Colletotrichum gloeosporioides 23]